LKQFKTNFALLLELSGMGGPAFSKEAGVSRSQLAMWRSGSRKFTQDGKWAMHVAQVFLSHDAMQPIPFISFLLANVFPLGILQGQELQKQLAVWIAADGQDAPESAAQRMELYLKCTSYLLGKEAAAPTAEKTDRGMAAQVVHGYHETQQTIANTLDYLATVNTPVQFTFVCPEGIDIITKDGGFGEMVLKKLMNALRMGHTLNVVLRTDFKMSEVSAFAGPWLVAHLLGSVKSWYYDDFRRIETERIIMSVPGVCAIIVTGDDYRCETFTDEETMKRADKQCRAYVKRSAQRFRYHLFEDPGGLLQGVKPLAGEDCYLFQRLPHLSIGGQSLLAKLNLEENEQRKVLDEFDIVFLPPAAFDKESNVYHTLCMDDIENALDKPRHIHNELQSMTGRRVYMDTQLLVDQLVDIRELLCKQKNYNVCFLNGELFEKIKMEVAVWGKVAAIGWLAGKQSTATTYYFNIGTLEGFCATVWSKIPKIARSKTAAERALGKLLNRAKKMGYAVNYINTDKPR